MSESESVSMLMNLTRENMLIQKVHITLSTNQLQRDYMMRINQYVEIGLLLTKFYRDEITATEIKEATNEYWRGSKRQKPCIEFYRLVNQKLERDFEKSFLKQKTSKEA